MADEKHQSAGTATEEAPGENTVQVTFLPEGKTVTVRTRQIALRRSRQRRIFARCRIELRHHARPRLRRKLRLHHLSCLGEGRRRESLRDGRRRSRPLDMAADLQLNSRLGCQAQITKPGKVAVEIPAWNRNYVSEEH